MVRRHTVMVWSHLQTKKSFVVSSEWLGGWQTKFNVQPRSSFFYTWHLRPSGPDLGPNLGPKLDLTWDLDLRLTILGLNLSTIGLVFNIFAFISPNCSIIQTVAVNVADSHEPDTILTNQSTIFRSRDQYRPTTDQDSSHVVCLSLSETSNLNLSQE